MKFIVFMLTSILFTNSVFSEEMNQFKYLELSKVKVSVDNDNGSFDGYGVEGKLDLGGSIYLNGSFQKYGNSVVDVSRRIIGIGAKYRVNDLFVPFGQIDSVSIKSESYGLAFVSKQLRSGVGVSGELKNLQYKIGVSRYFIEGSDIDDETVRFVDLTTPINSKFAIGLRVESAADGEIYSLAGRYHY